MAKNFIEALKHFADYRDISAPSVSHATVDVTEQYARRRLKLKKKDPLVYRGLALTCRGSRSYRASHS